MGGVNLSDPLIQHYATQHKTVKWYNKLLLHFLDIAATNAFILRKELMQNLQKDSMSHKQVIEELSAVTAVWCASEFSGPKGTLRASWQGTQAS